MFSLLRKLTQGLLAVAAVVFAACEADQGPVAVDPEVTPPTVMVNGVQLVTVAPSKRIAFADGAATVQRVKAQEGAEITNSDAKLVVQPGSVPDGTTIVMKAETDGYVSFKFGPNGLQFDPSATLVVKTDKANLVGLDLTKLAIAGASDGADDWVVIGGSYNPDDRTVSVPIDHFSRYALCTR